MTFPTSMSRPVELDDTENQIEGILVPLFPQDPVFDNG